MTEKRRLTAEELQDVEFVKALMPVLQTLQEPEYSSPIQATQNIINELRRLVESTLEMVGNPDLVYSPVELVSKSDIGPHLLENARKLKTTAGRLLGTIDPGPALDPLRRKLTQSQDRLDLGIKKYDKEVAERFTPPPALPQFPALFTKDHWKSQTANRLSVRSAEMRSLDQALGDYQSSRDAFINSPDKINYDHIHSDLVGGAGGTASIPVNTDQYKALRTHLETARYGVMPVLIAAATNLHKAIDAFDAWQKKSPESTRDRSAIKSLEVGLSVGRTQLTVAEHRGFLAQAPARQTPATSPHGAMGNPLPGTLSRDARRAALSSRSGDDLNRPSRPTPGHALRGLASKSQPDLTRGGGVQDHNAVWPVR